MSLSVKKIIFKTLKITGISIATLLILLFALPWLFPQTVSNKRKQFANGSINGQLEFSKTSLSFFKHFPNLTLTLYDLDLKGSAPFEKDTLVAAKEVSLGIDQILITNSRFVYNDRSLPMKFVARGVDYTGQGDLTKDVFDLHTHTEMQSVDFYYNDIPYVLGKKLNADLVTQINTKSLAFVFQKNDLLLNK